MRMILLVYLLFALLIGCKEPHSAENLDAEQITAQIQMHRFQKDLSFKNGVNSPIADEQKDKFEGLRYFPIDLEYRFRLPLQHYDRNETFKIITSSGMLRDAEKYGYFEFDMEGKPCKLNVYKLPDTQARFPGYLFVPFMDATTGKESYPGGRYLDLEENDSDIYDLDFNLAYNPSCAYGKEGYNCPIPPAENRLKIAIRAGEKNYLDSH